MKISLPILLVLVLLNYTHVVFFNIYSHSLPYGLYIRVSGSPHRDSYAAACLPQAIARYGVARGYLVDGNCPSGGVFVLKIIKGIPGDNFLVKNGFLELNGYAYPIAKKDSLGRSLRLFYEEDGVLNKGRYILLSDFAKNSWDSRYWGPVGIQFLLKPLWLFERD